MMIGHDGDSPNNPTSRASSRAPPTSDRQQFSTGGGPLNLDGKNHPASMKLQQQSSYPWSEGFKGLTIPQLEASKSLQQQQQQQQQRAHDEIERLQLFTFNLCSTYIPGTNKPKKVIPLDSSDGLRQSILNGEFYTRYENIAFDILQNQVMIPEFNIIDYIRREKSSMHEIERIESVHKRLGISPLISLLELTQQPRLQQPPHSLPPHNSSLLMKTSDSRLPPMDSAGNMDMRSAEQLDQQIQNVLRNSAYYRELTGGAVGLPQFPQLTNDRNRRSSQSPSDNLSSRSHNNTSSNTLASSSRTLVANSNQVASIQGHANTTTSYQPPGMNPTIAHGPIFSNPRNQPLAHTKPAPPSNPTSFFNPTMSSHSRPPPRSQSTIGPAGLSCRSPQSPFTTYPPRCPPQAHQNSVKSTVDLDPAHNPSNLSAKGPPISAHQSSRTPQLPKIPAHESLPPPRPRFMTSHHSPPGVRGLGCDDRSRMHAPTMLGQQIPNLPSSRSEIDPVSGLPLSTIFSIRQQELAMRTPGNVNFANNQPIGVHVSNNDHNRSTSSRPPSNPQMPPLYSPQNPMGDVNNGPPLGLRQQQMIANINNNATASSSMPPPFSDNHKNMNHMDIIGHNGQKPGMISGPNASEGPTEAQLKQYSALMNAYQQQHIQQMQLQHQQNMLAANHTAGMPLSMHDQLSQTGPNALQISTAPQSSETLLMDMNRRGSLSGDGKTGANNQQPSPRQSNQRSIITGSASSGGPKKSKKAKHSPPISQQPQMISPLEIDKCKQPPETENPVPIGVLKESDKPSDITSSANLFSNDNNSAIRDNISGPNETDKDSISGAITDSHNNSCEAAKPASTVATAAQVRNTIATPDHAARDQLKNEDINRATNPIVKVEKNNTTPNNSIEAEKQLSENSATIALADSEIVTSNPSDDNTLKSTFGQDNTTTSDNSKNAILPSAPITDEPQSKYQKLYTKKAWLKNYGLEDQSRSQINEAPEAIPQLSKVEIKSETLDSTTTSSSKPSSPKTNSVSKSNKTLKRKKKSKESSSKKSSTTTSKQSRPSKPADNDSGAHSSSTSELDSDDEDAMSVKKLRRMPRRKVKPPATNNNNNNNSSNNCGGKNGQHQSSPKSKTPARESNSRKKVKKEPVVEAPTKEKKEKATIEEESMAEQQDDECSNKVELQLEPCYEIVPKSIRCMECRRMRIPSTKSDKVPSNKQTGKNKSLDDFCRFYAFRKLTINKNSQPIVAGFSDLNDVTPDDNKAWLPQTGVRSSNMNYKVAKFILANIGDQFCNMTMQERAAQTLYQSQNEGDKKITWKRAVMGLRELCDVCATTLFNCHYVCEKCGFVACIECYQSRASDVTSSQVSKVEIHDLKEDKDTDKSTPPSTDGNENNIKETTDHGTANSSKRTKRDEAGWIYCARNEKHCHRKLTLSQIITSGCIEEVWRQLHDIRGRLKLGTCICERKEASTYNPKLVKIEKSDESQSPPEGMHSTLKGLLLASGSNDSESSNHSTDTDCNLQIHEDDAEEFKPNSVKGSSGDQQMFSDSSNLDDGPCEDLELLKEQVTKTIDDCIAALPVDGVPTQPHSEEKLANTISDKIREHKDIENNCKVEDCEMQTSCETHSWLCDGELLVLSEARQKNNIRLFRKQWIQGKPLVVRGVDRLMQIEMWLPQYFGKQFGDYRSDLVDCRNGDIHRHSMKKYWDGFEPSSAPTKRKVKEESIQIQTSNNDECSNSASYYSGSALWRLKDWPPGQDFFDILPEHYEDFMNNLPLKPYTTRTGYLNLAYRLPADMLKPDLGPKMYSAYGTSKFPDRGTTNLHLDISDAINVMIYVNGAYSFNNGSEESRDSYERTVVECCIDQEMKKEIISKKLVPGALWHVFKPSDAPKMRVFLNKVSEERNISPDKRTDPIHDQTWYLDQTLLDRLYEEQGVKPYAILQCMGDALVIPAGAPHQVKNLQNCIKVANDFVSPENVEYCLQLTNEFRSLPETHMNQEDKLQIKNILYHSVKQCLQYIQLFESGEIDEEEQFEDDDELDIE